MLWNGEYPITPNFYHSDRKGSGASLGLVPNEVTVPGCFGTNRKVYKCHPRPVTSLYILRCVLSTNFCFCNGRDHGKTSKLLDLLPLVQWLKIVFSFSILWSLTFRGTPFLFSSLPRNTLGSAPLIDTLRVYCSPQERVIGEANHCKYFNSFWLVPDEVIVSWCFAPPYLSCSQTQVSQSSSWPLAGRTSVV